MDNDYSSYGFDEGLDSTPTPESEKNGKKKTVKSIYYTITAKHLILYVLILAVIAAVCLIYSISGFTKSPKDLSSVTENLVKGDHVEGVPPYGIDETFLTRTHTINFIPVFKEYYYIIFSEDGLDWTVVRAGKHFGENFDAETFENIRNYEISGVVKRFDYKVKKEVTSMIDQIDLPRSTHVNMEYYIDLFSTRSYIFSAIAGVLNLLLIAYVIYAYKTRLLEFEQPTKAQKVMSGIAAAVVFAGCLLIILVLTMLD